MHSENIKIAPNGQTAILFIHGILGTPNHFADFVALVPDNLSIYNMLLSGHGGSAADFSRASMKSWKEEVNSMVDILCSKYDSIIIMAHSMGALLAINQSIELNDIDKLSKIKNLILLAVPLKISIKPTAIKNSLKIAFNRISETDAHALAMKSMLGVRLTKNPFILIRWIPRFLELLHLTKTIRSIINDLNISTKIFMSKKDELVSIKSLKYFSANDNIELNILENSAHCYYADDDYELLKHSFKELISKL